MIFFSLINVTTFQIINDPVFREEVKNKHAHSDENGRFTLSELTFPDTLHISHLLYESRNVVIDEPSTITTILKERAFFLDNVVISPDASTYKSIAAIDLQTKPVNNAQEVLRMVPGLVIGQHAGGGKAEQIFLRGFDIDHGTDIAINVDGIPVNMVSHAHGQGYADLHFLIPETIENIDFDKGPYYAAKGNFNTAGYIDFKTKSRLASNTVAAEYGQFNSFRALAMLDLWSTENASAYVAGEYKITDGYFESPQNFNRTNVFGKYSWSISDYQYLSLSASYFDSEWTASGQIPQRAISQGLISRFGAIDDTEGGKTGRTNLKLDHSIQLSDKLLLKNSLFYSNYHFELFSNFTFFAGDPINGDQIKQKENRDLFGFASNASYSLSDHVSIKAGVNIRSDRSDDNHLSHTFQRVNTLSDIRRGDIRETNVGVHVESEISLGKFLITPGLRFDYFDFKYSDKANPVNGTQTNDANILSPKLIVSYTFNDQLQLYTKLGQGFHSNDTRVVLESNRSILPDAFGLDLGMIWKPASKIYVNAALWQLDLEQEFVYVGDEGIVELSGPTSRKGIDLGLRYQISNYWFATTDANYTLARSIDQPEGENFIPLAPDLTVMTGISYNHPHGFFGGLRSRYLKDRPANEDNSIVAEGYFVIDANLGYKYKQVTFGLDIENLLNTEWNETQFATESRLQNEVSPVEEIHFTPGTPFFIKAKVNYNF